MRRLWFVSLLALAGLLVTSGAFALSFNYNFNTDQSASFTVVEFQAAGGTGTDSSINWVYDYSTHVQDAPAINVPIPSAPRSGDSSTIGVRLAVNLTAFLSNSLTLYPNLGVAAGGTWSMTVDVWANHNGDAGGNTGSTEFFGFGAQNDNAQPGIGSDGDNGFNYILTSDGGSASDARYSSGAGTMAIDNNAPAWFATATPPNNNFNVNPDWIAFFPDDGTLGTAPTGTVLVGAPGKQWLTVKLEVSNSGADRKVYFKRFGDAAFTLVSTITGGVGSSDAPCVGYADYFNTSVASEPTDQFVVFDNLSIDIPPASVADWNLY